MKDPRVSARLRSVVLDWLDPELLASFYAGLLSGRVATGDDEWCEVHFDDVGIKLAFQKVSTYQAPEWPDGVPQQVHLDLTVHDLDAASRRAQDLGAIVLNGPVEEPGCVFVVHADPAGHPFCLCADKRQEPVP
ncbi:MAG TPA: VOC family protein [Acidimicrobiales bacterium]|jgi:predicted enzyme related to lactoylglutathione lyase|nr:VOC family protein [Acidimicrobiales bacterium]